MFIALDIESFPIIPELGPWSPGSGPGNRSAIRIAVGGLLPRSYRFVEVDRPDPRRRRCPRFHDAHLVPVAGDQVVGVADRRSGFKRDL